jgi:hypothetical protein
MIRFSHTQCRRLKFKPKYLPGVLSLVVLLLLSPDLVSVAKAVVTHPADPWLQEDIISLHAAITAEVLTIQVVERSPLDDFDFHSLEVFLDADQNHTTEGARIVGLIDFDFRIGCLTGGINEFTLYRLPTEDGGEEEAILFGNIPGAKALVWSCVV